MSQKSQNFAYVTFVTSSSYVPGVILLGYTLNKCKSKFPLVVLYTDTVSEECVKALQLEAEPSNLVIKRTEFLRPRNDIKFNHVAERFSDTWTKFRVFQEFEYEKICYLDADMAIFKNMDNVFDIEIPNDWIAASASCVCNIDKDPWSPDDWIPENCAHTVTNHPEALTHPVTITPESRKTHQVFNAGMFLCYPNEELATNLINFFNTTPNLAGYTFADQDLLQEFFYGKWKNIGWQYNALKTFRYIHPNMWRDDEVCCLHYIVDKPWSNRNDANGVGGWLRRDGVTHSWWWDEYEAWVKSREANGAQGVVETMEKYVAKPLGEENGVLKG